MTSSFDPFRISSRQCVWLLHVLDRMPEINAASHAAKQIR
jgi:hypothetical protein